jgi:DNA-binding transcriptional regulator YiaG
MDCKDKIKELRESTGMNRKEFCEYFDIPYRTVTEWELGGRHAPEYVLRLLEYYIRVEKLMQSSKTAQDKNNGEETAMTQDL